jgi:uncharacterized RDD family membrane protein YckC
MKPAARNVLLVVALLLATISQAGAAARDLLAHGTDQFFWSADVVPTGPNEPQGSKTIIRYRTAGDQLRWKPASELAAQAESLGNRGDELLVVLEGGQWKIVSESGVRSGNPLPRDCRVLALAGDGDDIWAVGEAPRSAATATTATTTTSPSTAPALAPLTLFRMQRGEWKDSQPLPGSISRDKLDAVSLAMLDGKLTLAVTAGEPVVRIFTRTDGGWQGGSNVAALSPEGTMKLLTVRGRSALWVAEPGSPGALFLGGDKWTGPIKLKPSDKLKAYDRRTLAGALGNVRLLASDGKGRLAEQLYDLDGNTVGEASEAQTGATAIENRISRVIQIVVLTLLLLWMMMAVRQRPSVVEAVQRLETLGLASIPRRFIGGVIDALPLIIGMMMGLRASKHGPQPTDADMMSAEIAWISAGLAIYFLHTTITELLFARTVGKLVTGTRVAALDGSRPNALALLTRNLLRVVDVALFIPLLAVFSPLRQRVGDMGAGTVVVMADAPIPPPREPPPPAPPESS